MNARIANAIINRVYPHTQEVWNQSVRSGRVEVRISARVLEQLAACAKSGNKQVVLRYNKPKIYKNKQAVANSAKNTNPAAPLIKKVAAEVDLDTLSEGGT